MRVNAKSLPSSVRLVAAAFAFALLPMLGGCSKDKAEALKVAAEEFNRQASAAVGAYQAHLRQLIPAIALTPEEFATNLETLGATTPDKINAELVDGLLGLLTPIDTNGQLELDAEFARVQSTYHQFATALARVTQGHLFSRKPVQDAEALAAKLTLQLVEFQKQALNQPSIEGSGRSMLQLALAEALAEPHDTAKKERLRAIAPDFVAVHQRERQRKGELQASFARAIVAGDTLLKLIKDYERFSVAEVLSEIQHKLRFAATLTDSADVNALSDEFTALKERLTSDTYYAALLDRPLLNLNSAD